MANEAWPARQNKQHEPFARKNLGQIADAQYPPLDFILPEKKGDAARRGHDPVGTRRPWQIGHYASTGGRPLARFAVAW